MVRRARRNVVQWNGSPRDAALGIGEAKPAEAESESSNPKKRAGAKKKPKTPVRNGAILLSNQISLGPDGWRVRCSCGFTQVCTSKVLASETLAGHVHLSSIPTRSPRRDDNKTRRPPIPDGGKVRTVVQTPPSEVLAMWTFRWGQLTLDQQEAFLRHPQMSRIVGKNRTLIRRAISLHRRLSDIADFVNGKK
jgi:hypothetical protein